MLTTTVAAALAAAWLGVQQDRPTEEQLFGAPAQEAPPAQAKPAPEQKPGAQQGGEEQRPSEEEIFGGSRSRAAEPTPPEAIERAAEAEPLRIGGLIYLRAQTLWQEGESPRDWFLSSPNLTDLYLDVRPNDRVRGFVLGRLFYDPTIVTGGSASAGAATLAPPITIAGLGSVQPTSNPYGVLDQLWITSDIGRTVFVTAGRQHVKWGVGRFWNPTDYLHPIRRDPLAVFDVRTGSSMVRLQLPWEARGWNLYGVAMAEDVAGAPIPVNTLGRVAWGGRAEAVLAPSSSAPTRSCSRTTGRASASTRRPASGTSTSTPRRRSAPGRTSRAGARSTPPRRSSGAATPRSSRKDSRRSWSRAGRGPSSTRTRTR